MEKRLTLFSVVVAFLMCFTAGAQVKAPQRVPGQFNVPWGNYLTSPTSQVLLADGQQKWPGILITKAEGRHTRHLERSHTSGARLSASSRSAVKRAPINVPEEGQQAYYKRSGMAYNYSDGYIYQTSQTGHVEIVETDDGTVYIKDIISYFEAGTWVKGTKSGNTITIPTNQELDYYDYADVTFTINWVEQSYENGQRTFKVSDESAITFTVAGDVITLDNSSYEHFIGVCYNYQGEDYFDGEGDWDTYWQLDEGYVPASTDLVTPPDDMTSDTWYKEAEGPYGQKYTENVKLGFSGDDVYLGGLFSTFPDSWIKGSISGNTVTFESLQYQGKLDGTKMWVVGALKNESEISPTFTMTYDAENQVLTLDDDYNLFLNGSDNNLYYQIGYISLKITAQNPSELPVATGDPIDQIPYVNTFDTENDYNQFGIIDYNRDGYSWNTDSQYSSFVCSNGYGNVIADDWLISPAIKLEAGKSYRMYVDAWGVATNYVETFEVRMGHEPSASGMTFVALPPTNVTWQERATVEQDGIFVNETGYYHFGIHSISEYGYMLYVDNFILEAGAEPKSPVNVTDLSITPYEETPGATISFTAPTMTVDGTELSSNMSVKVFVDGSLSKTYEDIVPGSANTLQFEDNSLSVGYHTFYLVASNEAGDGKKSKSITVILKKVLDVPFTADLHESYWVDIFQIIDANHDGYTWVHDWWYNSIYYNLNSDRVTPADDYLVTLPIYIESGRYYSVVLNAYSNYETERFEVVVGKEATPEGLNIKAIEPTEVQAVSPMTPKDYEGLFMVPEDGKYYVAIHIISDADKAAFILNSLTIDKSLLPTSPAAPILTVTPAELGVLSAQVSITAPTKSYNGEELGDNFSKVELYRDGSLITTVTKEQFDAAAGTFVYTDNQVPNDGKYTYQAIPFDKAGERGEKTEIVEVYIGQDLPDYPKNLMITDNQSAVHIAWDAVTTGINGEYVNPDAISYNIWTAQILYGTYFMKNQLLGTTQETTFDFDYDTNVGEQRLEYWVVEPVNSAGIGTGALGELLVGQSYDLPVVEHFINNEGLAHYWVYNNNIEFWISQNATDGDANAIKFTSIDGSKPSEFATGKLNLKDTSYPVMVFDAFTESADTKLGISGIIDGKDGVALEDNVPLSNEYSTVAIPLEPLKEGHYAQVVMNMKFPEPTSYYYQYPTGYVFNWGDSLVIDNLHIVDLPLPTDVTMTLADGQVTVIWAAPITSESIVKYIIYVNGQRFDEVTEDTSYIFNAAEIEGNVTTVAVSAYYSYNVETPAVEATLNEQVGINLLMTEGKPVDIYDTCGRLIRHQATDLNGLKGLYIIKSNERVSSVILP